MKRPQAGNSQDTSTDLVIPAVKKARTDVIVYDNETEIVEMKKRRTSNLHSPVMVLSGHEAAVLTMRFSPDGKHLASGSFDKQIFLWDVYGECMNFDVLNGHKNAVMQVVWTPDGERLYSASADKTVGVWDIETGNKLRQYKGHASVVNAVDCARKGISPLLCSASDDGSIKIWDTRRRGGAVTTLEDRFQLLSAVFDSTGTQIIAGGIENDIKVWDVRKESVLYSMEGHNDSVTGLRLAYDGNFVLSNSRDQTMKMWDIRPYVAGDCRLIKEYVGHSHSFENNLLKCSLSTSGTRVGCGSSDGLVNIWDLDSANLKYKLPGHKGAVHEVDFHPEEPIIGSCGSDKVIYLGETAAF